MSAGPDRYPPQIKFIVGNEGCERFSFYGMRSILTVYMAQWLALPEHEAEANYHLFVMACYLTPLAGGWLADRLWGRYRVILWLSLGYVAGHATIAAFETRWGLLAGLTLIALGSGGIKPCVSAFVGDQFHPEQKKLLERVYGLFYWMVNLGSFGSTLLIPVLLASFGPRVAFAVPGLLMVAALALFVVGRRRYVQVPPTGPNPHAFTKVVASALRRRAKAPAAGSWLDAARADHPAEAVEGAQAVFRIMGVFAAVTAFWALFDQHGASWVLQARRMDLVVFGHAFQASQLAALNPLMVLLLIPLLQRVVFPLLERAGVRVTPLGKMTLGMFLTVLSFAAAALVEVALAGGARPSALWQVPQYVFLTSGEVLVSVTGLEFSYTQAPRTMKSTIMSIWMVTVALGNFLTAAVSAVNRFQGPSYFWFFTALMLAGAVGFAVVARRYRAVGVAVEPSP
ncbi:POT family MFS transporter [Anaeromyxobacter diazotrophicus]|uniref:Oligopeptide transporter n=1 Tax=Anaeromyxobacter diazotrophicus TaxID=2590199 RepID=A0A7I9VI92_9BACT|nr:POT family MFS transporter [Anaeromyxobacter diazotrophicus]GEJ55848.1 oligopeptide transporter [Anaeromyxobacter diazotrophicus]